MQILIVAATMQEIDPFLSANPSADFLVTGVGVPLALYHITKRIHQIDYDLVIQAGIAGSFNPSVALGEVVMVKEDCFADLGFSEKGIFSTVYDKGFGNENEFPFEQGWLINPELPELLSEIKLVRGLTINTITDEEKQIEKLKERYLPQIETMEGAALHFSCMMEKVPFIQLRSISNFVGERDKSKWKMKEAISNLNARLNNIVDQLSRPAI